MDQETPPLHPSEPPLMKIEKLCENLQKPWRVLCEGRSEIHWGLTGQLYSQSSAA